MQALPEKEQEPCGFPKDFRAPSSPGNSRKKQWDSQLSPHSLSYLKMQVSVRTGGVAQRCRRAASRGDVLREAARLLPRFEGTNHVCTMTYLQQTVSFGILVLLKLRPSQVLPLEHQEGGWNNQVPLASITTGDTGRGTGQ